MKRILLSALAVVPLFAISQVTVFSENFDSYNDQDWAGDVSSVMSTWSGSTGAGTDDIPITSAESSSPSNSIQITGPQAGGTQDAMITFPSDYTAGSYAFSMKYKVASGKGGYFNCHSTSTPPDRWMLQVYFASDGTGLAEMAGDSVYFNYTNGAWVDIAISADLDSDVAHFYVEGVEVGSGFSWSAEALGAATGNAQWGGLNLYSASSEDAGAADCEYYVDDLLLIDNTGVATGLGETILAPAINVVPNPSNGNFVLNYEDMSMENATVTLVDILGKTIYSEKMSIIGNSSLPFNMNLRNGVYFVSVANGSTKLTKKIIVKK
jgi:hypothetical protein